MDGGCLSVLPLLLLPLFLLLSLAAPVGAFDCARPPAALHAALAALPYAALLRPVNGSVGAHECLAHKRHHAPGLSFRPAPDNKADWVLETPLTRQFHNPNYQPALDPGSHPGCLFALDRGAVDWTHLTVLVVPTHQGDTDPVAPASVWLVDMAGQVVLQKDTIFRGMLRSQRMVNSTALMAMVDLYLAEATPQPVLLWVWDIATDQEDLLHFTVDLPPHHGAPHHDFTYNPNTGTVIVMYRFMNGDYAPGENSSLFMERLVEFSLDGKVLWHWDVHEHITTRHLHAADLAEHECQEHATEDCWDVFHGNSVFWDLRDPGEGDGVLYYNSRHLDTFWKIDKRTKRVVWALGPGGSFAQFNVTGHPRQTLLSHAHAPELYNPNEFVVFDNNYVTAEPSDIPGSRMVVITVDEERLEAREVAAWGREHLSHQAGNALRVPPRDHLVGLYTTLRHVIEADPKTGDVVWGYHLGLRHHTTLYRLERFAAAPTARLRPYPIDNVTACPAQFTFEVYDTFRPRVLVDRTGTLAVFADTRKIAAARFFFAPYWLPTLVSVALPPEWCAAPNATHSVALANQDDVGAQWPLEGARGGPWRLVPVPLAAYLQRRCNIPATEWHATRPPEPSPTFPTPREWSPSVVRWLHRLMAGQRTIV